MAIPLAIFAASRAVLYAVALVTRHLPGMKALRLLAAWQGTQYLSIATGGYPHAVVKVPGPSELGFFPLYPMLIRSLHRVSGISFERSALGISLVSAALAMVVLWAVIEHLTDEGCASRSIAVISFFPWAFVFSMAYSEALFLLLAGVCLLALLDEQWLTAGLAALLAGVAAPFGFVLFFPCAWAAGSAIRRRRWGAIVAPVLAPLGALGFATYLRGRTGDYLTIVRAQTRGVTYDGIGTHLASAGRVLSGFASHPLANLTVLTSLLAALLVIAGIVLMVLWKPPGIVWAYVVPLVGLGLWLDTFSSLPRTLLIAFPVLVALSRPLKPAALVTLVGMSAGLMAALFLLVGSTTVLLP